MKSLLRPYLPAEMRLQLRRMQRYWHDWRTGTLPRFVKPTGAQVHWPAQLTIEQPIRPGAHVAEKRHNLALAALALNDRVIPTGAILSLTALLGRPSMRHGYQHGRMLTGGKLVQEEGGGLCQLSGILYLLALQGGLQVIERHAHSTDIYTDESRFCPLGSDATIVYGYKDLRLSSPYPFALAFRIEVATDRLTASLCAPQPITLSHVEFIRHKDENGMRAASTYVDGQEVCIDYYSGSHLI